MTDFKPGDRVRLTEPYGGRPTGHEGTVRPDPSWFLNAETNVENLVNVLFDGDDRASGVYARRLEKVPVVTTFKVGDQVRLVQPFLSLPAGTVGVVTQAYRTISDLIDVRFPGWGGDSMGLSTSRVEKVPVAPKVDELTAENAKLLRDIAAADISYRSLEQEANRLSREVADKDFLIESRGRTIDNLRSALSKRNQEAADLKRRLSEADRTVTALQAAIDDFDQAKAGIQVGDLIHITNAGAQMALQTYRAIAVAGGKPTRVRFTGYDGSTAQENRNNDGRKSQRWVNDYTWEKVSS